MAGRGRGVAAFTFSIEALGIGRGSMPEARVGPSPLFPVSTVHTQTRTHKCRHPTMTSHGETNSRIQRRPFKQKCKL